MDNKEQIIKKFHPDRLHFVGLYFFGALFIIFSLFFNPYISIIGFLVIALAEIVRRVETFYILDNGVAREYRFFSTAREFAEYEKIQNLRVKQSLADNILGIGSVHVDTAGSHQTEVNFCGIKNPYRVEGIIREKMK